MMDVPTSLVYIAAIGAVAPTMAAVGALLVSMRAAKKVDENTKITQEVKVLAQGVIKATDGMKDELVRVNRSDAMQRGHTAGVADEKAAANGLISRPLPLLDH